MKKYMIAALFALVFAVPGMAKESSMSSVIEVASPEMDPQLVQDILRAAANECEYSYAEFQGMYDDGTAAIDKVPNGYRFSSTGGLLIIIAEDGL